MDNDRNRLLKIMKRLEIAQIIMPSAMDSSYRGTETIHLEFGDRKDNNVIYFDRHNGIQIGDSVPNGSRGFIEKVHQCCEEYLPILEKLSIKQNETNNKTETNVVLSHNKQEEEALSPSVEDIYDFLDLHFKLDVKKELFATEKSSSSIIVSGFSNKLTKKELTKYQIGYLFEYLFKEYSNLRSRVMFSYKGQGLNEYIEYNEAIRALNDKRKEIESKKTTDRILMKFADNLKKEFNLSTENNKTT